MSSCNPCLNVSIPGQIAGLLILVEMNENNLRWLQWTLEQSLKQHIGLIINLFPWIWRLFVVFVCSWIFDQDTKSQQFGLGFGLVFLIGIGCIYIARVMSALNVTTWCLVLVLCISLFGIYFDTTTQTFTLIFQGHPMMSHALKLGRTLWFYCGRNQFILVVVP